MSDFSPQRLQAKLKIAKKLANRGGRKGLRLGAEHLLGEALKIIPIEDGTLGNSGKVSVDSEGSRAAVSFNTVYAVRQHEDLTFKHDAGRRAKYLETPMNTEGAVIGALVAGAVKREMDLG